MFCWVFADGTRYELVDAAWAEALVLRLSREAERLRLFDEGFVRAVEDHWERRTLPGRYAEEEPWPRAFATRAELAGEVLRRLVAPVLWGLALRAEHGVARTEARAAPAPRTARSVIGLRGRS